jgi:hypothetical protein
MTARVQLVLAAALGLAVAACGPSGAPPELAAMSDQVVAVNQELVLTLAATDADGDELAYGFESDLAGVDRRARIERLPNGAAEFRWTPLGADVGTWAFDFAVSDGHFLDVVRVAIDVRSAIGDGSEPRFIHPAGDGTTFDLEGASCIAFDVEVFDADSREVALGLGEPRLEGAVLDQIGGTTAEFSWCPTEAQIAADDRYGVTLTADDGDNPIAQHPYLVVLRRGAPDCPGDPPVIAHQPADVSTVVGLTIAATVSDEVGLKREPLLYWSPTAPAASPDLASMNQLVMQRVAGDTKSGTYATYVPNPVAGLAVGETRPLYYVVVAVDDDDPEGACDNVAQLPATGGFEMAVTRPAGEGGAPACSRCSHDVQCGGAADLCVAQGATAEPFCLTACGAGASCPSGYVCSAAAVASVEGDIARQCVPTVGACAASTCVDDAREDDDSRQQASARPRLVAGSHELVSCPAASGSGDDEDWFEFGVTQDTTLSLGLVGGDASDLDLALYDAAGGLITSSVSLTSSETVSRCVPAGTYYARVYAYGLAPNPYRLTYQRTAGACP